MRRCVWIIALLMIGQVLKAQQDPQFSQNMHNHMTVNPGFAGVRGNWVLSGIYRNQWQKMPGAPETYAFNVDAPLKIGRADGGIGVNVMSDKIGMQTYLRFMVNYAYKCKLNFGVLSVGAKIGIVNSKIEGDLMPPDGNQDDPALPKGNADISEIMFDAGLGAFLSGDKYYAGMALAHLTRSEFKIGTTGRFFWTRHMYLTGGYALTMSPMIDLQPSAFIKTDFVSCQVSVNANVVYKKMYWGGLSYRYKEALIFMGGLELKNGILLGYSYDWDVSDVGKYVGGTHEVTLSYSFGMKLGKREKIYKSVRFL